MAPPLLGLASALRRNINRVLLNIIRSGPSARRRAPKNFSYQLEAAAGSGTFRWMWSYGKVCAVAEAERAPRAQQAAAVKSMSCRITNSFSELGPRRNRGVTGAAERVASSLSRKTTRRARIRARMRGDGWARAPRIRAARQVNALCPKWQPVTQL